MNSRTRKQPQTSTAYRAPVSYMDPPAELQKVVVELVVVKRPLSTKRPDQASGYKVPHEGCVATTKDGEKYLIEKGVAPDHLEELYRIGGDKGSRIVKLGDSLPFGFNTVASVPVKCKVTLLELLEASGVDYNWICNNCWNSTKSMKRVVTDELHLPWQFVAGISVGVVAVFAMALFAIDQMVHRSANRQ